MEGFERRKTGGMKGQEIDRERERERGEGRKESKVKEWWKRKGTEELGRGKAERKRKRERKKRREERKTNGRI